MTNNHESKATREEAADGVANAAVLFASSDNTSLADGFKDKVAALHAHFDRDGDGTLNHAELRGLQLLTAGTDMDKMTYVLACRSVGCDPHAGVSLDGLRLVYAAEGTDVDEDYAKVFPGKAEAGANDPKNEGAEDDDVLEIGEDGVDVSA